MFPPIRLGRDPDALWTESARALGLDLKTPGDPARGIDWSPVVDRPGIRNPMVGTRDGVPVVVHCRKHSERRYSHDGFEDGPTYLYAEVSAVLDPPLRLGLRARVDMRGIQLFSGPPVVACDMARATQLLYTRGEDGWCPMDMMSATAQSPVRATMCITTTDAAVTCELRPSLSNLLDAKPVYCEEARLDWALGRLVPIVRHLQEMRRAVGPWDWERDLAVQWAALASEKGLELDAAAMALRGTLDGVELRLTVEGGEGDLFTRLVARWEPKLTLDFTLRAYNWLPRGWVGKAVGFLTRAPPPLGDTEFDKAFYLLGKPRPEVYIRLTPSVRKDLMRLRAYAREPGDNTRQITVDDHGIFASFKGAVPGDTLASLMGDVSDVARAMRGR